MDAALVCTGRVPATKDMGLEENGIETFRGFVQVTSLGTQICLSSLVPEHQALSQSNCK